MIKYIQDYGKRGISCEKGIKKNDFNHFGYRIASYIQYECIREHKWTI